MHDGEHPRTAHSQLLPTGQSDCGRRCAEVSSPPRRWPIASRLPARCRRESRHGDDASEPAQPWDAHPQGQLTRTWTPASRVPPAAARAPAPSARSPARARGWSAMPQPAGSSWWADDATTAGRVEARSNARGARHASRSGVALRRGEVGRTTTTIHAATDATRLTKRVHFNAHGSPPLQPACWRSNYPRACFCASCCGREWRTRRSPRRRSSSSRARRR